MGDRYAQDIITGKLVWTKYMVGTIRTPAISKGVLYLPGDGQNMTALDAATGNQIWSKYFYLDNRFQAMNITNDIIYFVAQQDNRVYSVNAMNGNLNWQSIRPSFLLQRRLYLVIRLCQCIRLQRVCTE